MKLSELNYKGLNVGHIAAIDAARRSSIYSFKTGAAIIRDNKIVSIGWSHVGTIKWKETPWSTHAEAHALQRAGFKVEGCAIYIATLNKTSSSITHSRPCEICSKLIKQTGIEEINFFDVNNNWRVINV